MLQAISPLSAKHVRKGLILQLLGPLHVPCVLLEQAVLGLEKVPALAPRQQLAVTEAIFKRHLQSVRPVFLGHIRWGLRMAMGLQQVALCVPLVFTLLDMLPRFAHNVQLVHMQVVANPVHVWIVLSVQLHLVRKTACVSR
jgi:hypothetical protein